MHKVRVVAVGDLQVGDSATCVGFGFRTRYSGTGLDAVFAQVGDELAQGDIVFGNLESTLSSAGLRPGSWRSSQMRGEPEFATGLRRAGFSVLNVANNHATQHGVETFRKTVELLGDAGIHCCGLRGSPPWSAKPVVMTVHGETVGILGYCLRPRLYQGQEPPYAEGDQATICADVRRLGTEVDYVVVSLHWGKEFVGHPSTTEVALGRAIVDAGAALILGHHPHVVRPVERRGNALIAYSLGNFAADMVWDPRLRQGAMLRCELAGGGVDAVTVARTAIDSSFRPVLADGSGQEVVSSEWLQGLDEEVYEHEVRRTVRAQRLAAYRYAARNVRRFPVGMLGQLAANTLRNKIIGRFGRTDGEYY